MRYSLSSIFGMILFAGAVFVAAKPAIGAEGLPAAGAVTFSKDIAPIFQRSCQNCHQPNSVAPMSLISYTDARPWAKSIKARVLIRNKRGAMPPWYIEKNIGIQHYKNDNSLSDDEIAKIVSWADNGAPEGNPADLPPAKPLDDGNTWAIGTPDLIISTKEVLVKGNAPDWWGEIESVPTGLKTDRYVAALPDPRGERCASGRYGRGRWPCHGRRSLRIPSHDLGYGPGRRRRNKYSLARP